MATWVGRADPAGIVAELRSRGQTVATCESLTGGLLAAAVVDVPGASAVFRGGLVTYATDLKATLAAVPEQLLASRGPVDATVARYMAAGARERCGADWALATTGVAGPEPQDGQPVGRVYVSVAGPDGTAETRELRLPGDRGGIRAGAVNAALLLLWDAMRR